MSVYTLGIWLVHPGRENDFVQAWRDLARKTQEDFPHAKAVLMHDHDVRNRFISTGPWESLEQAEVWRASEVFKQSMEGMQRDAGAFRGAHPGRGRQHRPGLALAA